MAAVVLLSALSVSAKNDTAKTNENGEIIKTDEYKFGEGQLVYDFKTNNRVNRNDFDLTSMSVSFGQEKSDDPTSVTVMVYVK